ncbi:nucleotide-diphospho-sugar transferase [Geopyxis carbonaria]|nr:nucleotide-diphospho-sugar transferase [Geopyxis carbonaria]
MATEPRKRTVDSPRAWTTLITNVQFIPGLLVLDYSLKRAGSKYPLLALYTDTLEPAGHAALDKRGIAKQRVEYVIPALEKDYSNDTRFYHCWSKLQPFGLTEYERIVQLDSDMLVRQNMDELMEMDLGDNVFGAAHACVCNPLKRKHYPADWIPENCGFTAHRGNRAEAAETGASCTFGLGHCNGGNLIVQPSAENYAKICAALADPSKTGSYDFADQSLLSDVFEGRWLPLSYKYNALKTMRECHAEIWDDDVVKNVHYILMPKPWEQRDNPQWEVTHKWWWEVDDERRAKEKEMGIEDEFSV